MTTDDTLSSSSDEAVGAYLTLVKNKGASTSSINKRKHFLRYLTNWLNNKPRTGESYRAGVDATMEKFSEEETRYFFLVVAREFYYFWIGDVRAIATLNATGGFEGDPIRVEIKESLMDLLAKLDVVTWREDEMLVLRRYLACLYSHGMAQSTIDIRDRLLKVLLYQLRDMEMNGNNYRAVIDALLPLFKKAEARYTFLALAREFYYFWINDPNAVGRVSAGLDAFGQGKILL